MGETLESAIILDVNTMNQKCVILENPLIKDFIAFLVKFNNKNATKSDIDSIINQLKILKGVIPK
jgi:hypothetical protein